MGKTSKLLFALLLAFVLGMLTITVSAALNPSICVCDTSCDQIFEEWNYIFASLFKDALWSKEYIYDAGHFLMIPLHAAFYFNNKNLIESFSNQFLLFMSFLDGRGISKATEAGGTNDVHYVYLASRFAYLSFSKGYGSMIPPGLLKSIEDFVILWGTKATWRFNQKRMNMNERFSFIMNDETTEYKYHKTIPDLFLFITAIAADLLAINKMMGMQTPNHELLKHIVNSLYELLNNEVVFFAKGDRWLLHPGRWSDYNDYLYAGHNEISMGMETAPIDDIAQDSSHFHRFPLFIESWKNAFPKSSVEYSFFEKLRTGLAEQMISSVIVPPSKENPYYRLTNYMDGKNGVYQYKYSTTGKQRGYLPYQLSGTFLLGWWSFLQDVRITSIYKAIYDSFPLSDKAISCYTGPNTTRTRHPRFTFPECLLPKEIIYYITYFASNLGFTE